MITRFTYGPAVKVIGLIFGLLISSGSAHAGTKMIEDRTLPFEKCVAYIQFVETKLSVKPNLTVDTQTSKIAQFPLTDGSGNILVVICSRPDQKMVVSMITRN